jgi:uncharacterized protein YqjF (DUF2071 family)
MFAADWLDVVFVHFRVDRERLQRIVPLELDLFDGRDAYVSLVAFTQANLRPTWGGRLGRMIVSPIGTHEFLNVRTYVRHGQARGIYFMAEWIPNRLAQFIGPRTYGLPYRFGRLRYEPDRRMVQACGREFSMRVVAGMGGTPMSRDDLLDEFLLERYTAFTHRRGVVRRFDVEHAPWPQERIEVDLADTTLLCESGEWLDGAELIAAHHSPGVHDVRIGWPVTVTRSRRAGFPPFRRRATSTPPPA